MDHSTQKTVVTAQSDCLEISKKFSKIRFPSSRRSLLQPARIVGSHRQIFHPNFSQHPETMQVTLNVTSFEIQI